MSDVPLLRRDRAVIALTILLVVGYGAIVELRSAFLTHRHTDLGVYLRAAWAIREGGDPYAVEDNGWHYTYPSLFATLLVPLAEPPPGVPRGVWDVPFPVTVALWYLASVAALFWSIHALCRLLDEARTDGVSPARPGSRRFWWVRSWPFWICLPAVASTLSRGQVNLFLLALLSAFISATLRGKRAAAGWWLAAATCWKVIPALLILDPLYRRDWRTLGHFALGLIVGLVVIPVVALGPERALATSRAFAEHTLLPGLTEKQGPLSRELTNVNGTDNQSIQAIIHNARHLDPATRPGTAEASTKAAHVLIGLALLAATFLAARRIPDERSRVFFRLGGLLILMVALSPVNHTHYMVMALPVVVGLVHGEIARRGNFTWGAGLILVVSLHVASGVYPRIPVLPGYQAARDLGVTMLGTLVVWWAGLTFPARAAVPLVAGRPRFVWFPFGHSRK
jgi:hypothetical protein